MTTSIKSLLLACKDERALRHKSFKELKEIEDAEKALEDFKRQALFQWLETEREDKMDILYKRADDAFELDDHKEDARFPLPYETDDYKKTVSQLEKRIENLKNQANSPIDMYERFLQTEWGRLAFRKNKNDSIRVRRLKKRIEYMFALNRRVFFLTFTFNDESLSRYSEKRLKRAVLDYVREHCDIYIVNKDFGATNARLHYHALVIAKNDYMADCWSYGFFRFQKCGKKAKDAKALGAYITKLARHAVKETTATDERLIYCRVFASVGV